MTAYVDFAQNKRDGRVRKGGCDRRQGRVHAVMDLWMPDEIYPQTT
jgi:hypothetical protein